MRPYSHTTLRRMAISVIGRTSPVKTNTVIRRLGLRSLEPEPARNMAALNTKDQHSALAVPDICSVLTRIIDSQCFRLRNSKSHTPACYRGG